MIPQLKGPRMTTFLLLVLLFLFSSNASGQSVAIAPLADVTVTTAATWIGSGTSGSGNAFRNSMSCTNQSSTINVRWGDSSITTTKGQRVPAGATVEIYNRGAIYMIAESSTAVVSCTEETR